MPALIATAHIAGAIIVLLLFSIGTLVFSEWESRRNLKADQQETAIALCISIDDFWSNKNQEKISHFTAERFSSELLRNRLSDFCGWIQATWGWTSDIIQAGIFIAVIWYTITDSLSNAIYAWTAVAVAIFSWITSVLFGYICKLLTGRFPGQAKRARKFQAEELEKRRKMEGSRKN